MTRNRAFTAAFVAVVALALGGAAVYNYQQTQQYKLDLQYGYARSLNDLRDCVDNIDTTLTKAQYANTATEQNGLAANLMRESSMAKAAVSVLPLSGNSLDNVTKFITQVGDFSMSISRKIAEGYKISDGEMKSMQNLQKYSVKLRDDLESLQPDFGSTDFSDSFKQTSQDFTDFPSLIYDGPFSDHINQRKPKLLEGQKPVLQGNAQTVAADFLGLKQSDLVHAQDTAGNLPTFNFTAFSGSVSISVTKTGGIVSTMADTRAVSDKNLDYEAASKKAETFLQSRGYKNMKESYYAMNDGLCLINFAYTQDGVVCYPDLIKVGVALDNGSIVRFEAAGYLMNHTERKLSAKLTQAQAQKSVSPNLKVKQGRPALIPTSGLNEILCYEFLCTGKSNDNVLVYINANNGFEENILILTSGDGGTLAK